MAAVGVRDRQRTDGRELLFSGRAAASRGERERDKMSSRASLESYATVKEKEKKKASKPFEASSIRPPPPPETA
jgi:hypothetical protein